MKSERCPIGSIKNMRAKRQASGSSSDTVVPLPIPLSPEPKRFNLSKRQSSGSSSDEVPHRPPKLFFARRSSGGRTITEEPLASPSLSVKSSRSPGIKGLCRRGSREEQQPQPQPVSLSTSTSTLVEVALAQISPAAPPLRSPLRRQSSIDTLVEEHAPTVEIPAASAAQMQKREGLNLTDQQLMLIIVALAVSQCFLLARLRAAAM
ncbi:hypothetical protein AURDEDRAFT_145766 [Auricularia subglabra TFB-10046 SS5]|nr:hypothetical protein AURDEDRAFT_145766 [Auricularia subglabra TFB-10046 SS5]